MKMDLPKRRSQQKRARQWWRFCFISLVFLMVLGIGLFFAKRHQTVITNTVTRYSQQYKTHVDAWAKQKEIRLKSEMARFKPHHETPSNDVTFQFYSELSDAKVKVEEDPAPPKTPPRLAENNKAPSLENTFNPDEIAAEFEETLPDND